MIPVPLTSLQAVSGDSKKSDPRIIVALDCADINEALRIAAGLDPRLCRVKVGKELFTAAGPDVVRQLIALGYAVFLDLKFHDIPHTVAAACRVAVDLGVWMLTVHASGGRRMLDAAVEAVSSSTSGSRTVSLVAVTVLTSMTEEDARLLDHSIHGSLPLTEKVSRLAKLAESAGLDGVVCAATEAALLRSQISQDDFCLVSPGIRLSPLDGQTIADDDQRRCMTPSDALHQGVDYLVVGRPITRAEDPLDVLKKIHTMMAK